MKPQNQKPVGKTGFSNPTSKIDWIIEKASEPELEKLTSNNIGHERNQKTVKANGLFQERYEPISH